VLKIIKYKAPTGSIVGVSFLTRYLTPLKETDSNTVKHYSFFDLRERETFIQITNIDPTTVKPLK